VELRAAILFSTLKQIPNTDKLQVYHGVPNMEANGSFPRWSFVRKMPLFERNASVLACCVIVFVELGIPVLENLPHHSMLFENLS